MTLHPWRGAIQWQSQGKMCDVHDESVSVITGHLSRVSVSTAFSCVVVTTHIALLRYQ